MQDFSVPSFIGDPTFNEAVRRGRPVLRFDLYWRGHSSNPDVTHDVDLFAVQVVELLAHLGVNEPVDLVGLSMGGGVCVRTAAPTPASSDLWCWSPPAPLRWAAKGPRMRRRPPTRRSSASIAEQMPTWADRQSADFYDPDAYPGWVERRRPWPRYENIARALLSSSRS